MEVVVALLVMVVVNVLVCVAWNGSEFEMESIGWITGRVQSIYLTFFISCVAEHLYTFVLSKRHSFDSLIV